MTRGRDNVAEVPVPARDHAHNGTAAGADAAGDGAGFDAFIRVQYRALVSFLRRRTSTTQDAEDVAQESLARMLRYRDSGSQDAWRPLLYRIAINASHDHARHHAAWRDGRRLPIEECELHDSAPTPEEHAQHEQQRQRLREAILSLPPKCQRVYLLKRSHGLSHAEVAKRCGISVKMVDKHLATAFLQLQRMLGGNEGGAL